MKENVVPTGTNFKGLPKYNFNYIKEVDPEQKTYTGVIAQDVQKKYPDMVHERDGYLYVDYAGLQSKKDRD